MRYDEMQHLAGALLALLDGSASEQRTLFGQLPTERRELPQLLRRGAAAQGQETTDTLTATEAETFAWGAAASTPRFPVGEIAKTDALRFTEAAGEEPALSVPSADARVFTACYGEALEELDRRFRRDSRRYDSGFAREE